MSEHEPNAVRDSAMRPSDFAELLESERAALVSFCLGITKDHPSGEDLAQRALLRAVKNHDRFEEGTNLRAWLFTIAKNCHIDDMRKRQRRGHPVELEDAPEAAVSPPNQVSHVELRELQASLKQMSAEDREVLLTVAAEERSYEDAAEILDVKVGTVKSRLSRARARLRELMPRELTPREQPAK